MAERTIINGTDVAKDALLNTINDNFTLVQGKKGSDIASATTTDLSTVDGTFAFITGTTAITGLGTMTAGISRKVKFTGILTLTYNATSLILPTGASITTAVDDIAEFTSLGSGNWICTNYMKADGTPLIGGGGGGAVTTLYGSTIGDILPSTETTIASFIAGQSGTLTSVRVDLDIAPTGSSATVDVYKNGSSIGIVTITAASTSGSQGTFSDTAVVAGAKYEFKATGGTTVRGGGSTYINFIIS